MFASMVWMLLFLLVSLAVAGLVVVYVAYPRRGEQVPRVPWLGEAMTRGVKALPTLDNQWEHLDNQRDEFAQHQPSDH